MGVAVQESAAAASSRKPAVIALQVIFIFIALVVFVLRIYTRARLLRSVGSDDYIMGVAMVSESFDMLHCDQSTFNSNI
jgi:hypothetical protein